ncbi:MAG TPA: hypothetical protein VFN21_12810 [Acidimicrobiales bacterium]|nr:hypothetical protein [Acidimicrobiales bacterium]
MASSIAHFLACFTSWVDIDLSKAFAIFPDQDSGCRSYGIELEGARWFVKVATSAGSAESLRRAIAFHRAVTHPVIVAPHHLHDGGGENVRMIFPWHDGEVLNAATRQGSDRSGLLRFQTQPLDVVLGAAAAILDAHLSVTAAGYVAVDLYDGAFLWDEVTRTMRLIDLDEYRPGPFTVSGERLPGSTSYMAPEELRHGGTIDERTTVFGLGRALHHLIEGHDRWRGSARQRGIVARATATDPNLRFPSVADLVTTWTATPNPP